MCAIQEVCLLFIHFPHIPQKWSSYMTSGCCFTLKDSVDTSSVCCYLAISNLFSGCKKFKLMNLLKINSKPEHFCLLQLPMLGSALLSLVWCILQGEI